MVHYECAERNELARIEKSALRRVREQLLTNPEAYGKPLRKELHGCYAKRIGDERLIYHVSGEMVTILIIGARRDDEVYKEVQKRL